MVSGRVVGVRGLLLAGLLLWAGCGSSPPPADPPPVSPAPLAPDGSAPDAGGPGGSVPDASAPDAGEPDGGAREGGATRWLHHLSEPKHEVSGGVAVSAAGAVFSVATHGVETAYGTEGDAELRVVLTRLGADGAVVWTRSFPVTRPPPMGDIQDSGSLRVHIAADAAGEVFLSGVVRGSVDFGGGALRTGAFLAKLSRDGGHRWSQLLPADHEVSALSADAAGNVYVGALVNGLARPDDGCVPLDGRVAKYSAQGTQLWEVSIGQPQCDGNRAEVHALAVDRAGRVALGGVFSGELRFGEQRFSTSRFSPYLAVLDADGALVWLRPFAEAWGEITSVGMSWSGTVVAAGKVFRGHLDWAGARVESRDGGDRLFLLVAEAGGQARWAKDLGAGERPVLSVEPTTSVVVAGLTRSHEDPAHPDVEPGDRPQLFASRYALDGTHAWTRLFSRSEGAPDLFAEQVTGVAVLPASGGACVLAGQFTSPTDFGTGPRTSGNTDTFVLRLAP